VAESQARDGREKSAHRALSTQAAILAQEQIFYRACTAPVLTYQGSKECHSWLTMYRAVLYDSGSRERIFGHDVMVRRIV